MLTSQRESNAKQTSHRFEEFGIFFLVFLSENKNERRIEDFTVRLGNVDFIEWKNKQKKKTKRKEREKSKEKKRKRNRFACLKAKCFFPVMSKWQRFNTTYHDNTMPSNICYTRL